MKALRLCALPVAALLLSSAMPANTLGYDFRWLLGTAPECAHALPWGCTVLGSRREALAEAKRQRLILEARLRAEAEAAAARQAAIDAGLKIVISIPQQRLYAFRGGALLATSPVSTGKRGHGTPAGTFPILQKKVHHRSNLYSNAPMPFMQRLTWGGVALHAGSLPGYPASHGCIRMPWGFAKKLYGMTSWTTRVTITPQHPGSADEALAMAHPTGGEPPLPAFPPQESASAEEIPTTS